jgi:hypothetical protein
MSFYGNRILTIYSSGGGRTLDEESGRMIQRIDQDRSSFGLGFERAKQYGQAVAIIAGERQ